MLEKLIALLKDEKYKPTNDFQKGFQSGLEFCIRQAQSLLQAPGGNNSIKDKK